MIAWRIARAHTPRHTWSITGIALGFVISPLSLGLYSTYFVGLLPTGVLVSPLSCSMVHLGIKQPSGLVLCHHMRLCRAWAMLTSKFSMAFSGQSFMGFSAQLSIGLARRGRERSRRFAAMRPNLSLNRTARRRRLRAVRSRPVSLVR